MALYGPAFFEQVFVPLAGKRIGYFPLNGNVGDQLGHQAVRGLFNYFGIDFEEISAWQLESPDGHLAVDELVISGGGNMGTALYRVPSRQRRLALATGLPITVFPQTFFDNEEDLSGYKKIYVRERRSLSLNDRFELAPDMAMGLDNLPPLNKAAERLGVFLRRDLEARFPEQPASLGDPAAICTDWQEYLELAGMFGHVVTDRLHFAIAALLQNRSATLLPNSYWKNRAVFDSWLEPFECAWAEDPAAVAFDPGPVVRRRLHRLAAAPGKAVDWSSRPVAQPGYHLYEQDGSPAIRRPDGRIAVRCNEHTRILWALCDGSGTVSEILDTLRDLFPGNDLVIARDLQTALGALRRMQAIRLLDADTSNVDQTSAPAGFRTRRAGASQRMEIVVEPALPRGEEIIRHATLKENGTGGRPLWFRYHRSQDELATDAADPFLLATLMRAMRQGCDIEVANAPVSSGLLPKLERFQRVWTRWRSDLAQVEIRAESRSGPPAPRGRGALLAFSGGVDSCFTASEYVRGNLAHQEPAAGALMIHGFDMPWDGESDAVFERAADRSRRILDDIALPLLAVRTNIKGLCNRDWLDYHGLMLSASLTLFREGFAAGVIAATMPFEMMMPLGSNAVSDPLMSSDGFEIIHHGGYSGRMEKLGVVGRWPVAARNLRVCWQGTHHDRNCGVCLKCVLTHLGMWAHGLDAPCFEVPLGIELVNAALGDDPLSPLDWLDVHSILGFAAQNELDAPWIPLLRYKLSIRH